MGSKKRQTGFSAAVLSLISTIIGGGVLSLPFTIASAGLLAGPMFLGIIAVASNFSLYILVAAARASMSHTYEELAFRAFGPIAQGLTVLMIITLIFLSCIAYVILIRDLVSPLVEFMCAVQLAFWGRAMCTCAAMLCVLPLCFLRSLNTLRWSSAVSICSIFVLAGVVGFRSLQRQGAIPAHVAHPHTLDPQDSALAPVSQVPLKYMGSWADITYAIPIMSVAYLCHFNMLPLHCELIKPTRRRIANIVNVVICLCTLLYIEVGVFGYLYAREKTDGNILNNFPSDDPLVTFGRMGLSLACMFSFPLLVHPCRLSLQRLLWLMSSGSDEERESLMSRSSTTLPWDDDDDPPEFTSSQAAHVMQTLGIVFGALTFGVCIRSIATIWNLMGSTASIIIAYIFPAAFYIKLHRKEPYGTYLCAWLLMLVGVATFFLCSYEAVSSLLVAGRGETRHP